MVELLLLEQLKYKKNDPEAYKALRLQVRTLPRLASGLLLTNHALCSGQGETLSVQL